VFVDESLTAGVNSRKSKTNVSSQGQIPHSFMKNSVEECLTHHVD